MAQFKKEKKEMYLNAMVSCCVGVIPDKWANYKVPIDRRLTTNWHCYISLCLGRLNSWVVSHSALIIGKLCHALGCEFKPWWWQTLFRTQAQHLCFIHDSIWFICLSKFVMWIVKQKIENKRNLFKKIYIIVFNICRPQSGQILRLRGGSGPHSGFLQIHIQGEWLLVRKKCMAGNIGS